MKTSARPKIVVISITSILLILVSLLLVSSGIAVAVGFNADKRTNNQISALGENRMQVNTRFISTLRFSPDKIHVKSGDTIVLTDSTTDPHSFTLIDPSLYPANAQAAFECGARIVPNIDICARVFGTHLPGGLPPFGTTTCSPTASTPCFQYVDGGVASSTNTLGLDTQYTLTADGDSVLILPGNSITLTVTAPPGTVIHFMCVLHAFMQGVIIVD